MLSTAPIPVLVHFYAQWSAPCRLLASELAMLAPEFEGRVEFVKTDIDHSPDHYLAPANQSLYTAQGLALVRDQLTPSGTFALWSNDPANEDFTAHLRQTFPTATAHNIEFPNPYTNSTSVNSVYVAQKHR